MSQEEIRKIRGKYIAIFMCIGCAIGIAISSFGIAIGVGIGIAIGAGVGEAKAKEFQRKAEETNKLNANEP